MEKDRKGIRDEDLIEEEEVGDSGGVDSIGIEEEVEDLASYESALGGRETLGSWQRAREIVERFDPVPWFIHRLTNHVWGPSEPKFLHASYGFGLRRLILAIGSDSVLGEGREFKSVDEVLKSVSADRIAAGSVLYSVSRRIQQSSLGMVLMPILEDALLRARFGAELAHYSTLLSVGRFIIAGFAGRCGLAIMLSSDRGEKAQRALEMMAEGRTIQEVGNLLYGCDPLQISALMLSIAGCGAEAARGIVLYSSASYGFRDMMFSEMEKRWFSAFRLIEKLRVEGKGGVEDDDLLVLGISLEDLEEINFQLNQIIKQGHGWSWIV